MDALLSADRIQPACALQQGAFPIALADYDQTFLTVVQRHIGVIRGHIGKIIDRTVVIQQIVHIAAKKLLRIIQTGNSKH